MTNAHRWRRLGIAYMLVALVVAWPLTIGIFFHASQAIRLRHYDGVHEYKWAREARRDDLVMAMALGLFYAATWPVGVPLAFMVTGFAEHGIWNQSRAE